MVDLHVWLRNLRGNVSEAAVATISLPVRSQKDTGAAGEGAATGVPARPGTPFAIGDRVRLRAPQEWPAAVRSAFAGAEGTVSKWVDYDAAMVEFADVVVCVRIDNAFDDGEEYVGSPLLFRPDDLECIG